MILVAAVRRELSEFLGRLRPVPATVFVTTGLALFVYSHFGSSEFFERVIANTALFDGWGAHDLQAASYFYWYGSAFVILGLVPWAVLKAVSRASPDDAVPSTGLGPGDWRFGLATFGLFYGIMLAVLAGLLTWWPEQFVDYYPMYGDADRSLRMLLAYEAAYFVYFIAWEYFFRGFMTFGLEKTLGVWTIFVQMLPFVVMHFGKPDLEAMSSIFGGIALGWLALRTRSVWWCALIHACTAVTLDLLVLWVGRA